MNIEALNDKQREVLPSMALAAGCFVMQHVSERERWCQLAEEAAELAQAALKVVRAMDESTNPTSISYAAAKADVMEELADVENVYTIVPVMRDTNAETKIISAIADTKMVRWAERLGWTYPIGEDDGKDTETN